MGRKRWIPLILLALLPVPGRGEDLSGVADPHRDPPSCPSCHVKVPDPEEAASGEYFLLRGSIDETCCICHPGKCTIAEGWNHPSNINRRNRKEVSRPRNLPLYDGYITCLTCHYRNRPAGPDYKRVRIVEIGPDKHDWDQLCRDCHEH